MRPIKIIIIFLILISSYNSFAEKFNIYYKVTSLVECNTGDTLVFHSAGWGLQGVFINEFDSLLWGGMRNDTNVFLVSYTVQAQDSNFIITYQPGDEWKGTIKRKSTAVFSAPVTNLLIYPNPASDYLKIENIPANSMVRITDIKGKLCKSILVSDIGSNMLDVKDLGSGIYILEVSGLRRKFIK